MRRTSSTGRAGRILAAAVISLGLIAAACSKKDDESTGDTTEETTADTSGGETTVPDTTPEETPVPGGELVVSGEAEVANPWTPAAMQCDSYCQIGRAHV